MEVVEGGDGEAGGGLPSEGGRLLQCRCVEGGGFQVFGDLVIVGVVVVVERGVGMRGGGLHSFGAEVSGKKYGAVEQGCSRGIAGEGFESQGHFECHLDAVAIAPRAA